MKKEDDVEGTAIEKETFIKQSMSICCVSSSPDMFSLLELNLFMLATSDLIGKIL